MIQPTKKQASILSYIRRHTENLGYPPTIREIANEFGLASTKGVKAQLDALEKKGLLRREGRGARALEVVGAGKRNIRAVPVLGRVPAGQPIPALENTEGEFLLDKSLLSGEGCFLLHVTGESMIEESILDGDYALVKPQPVAENGDIVVAMVNGEATLKRFRKEDDRIVLEPANRDMAPLVLARGGEGDIDIVGKVIAVLRLFKTDSGYGIPRDSD
jgi:repressor LexA